MGYLQIYFGGNRNDKGNNFFLAGWKYKHKRDSKMHSAGMYLVPIYLYYNAKQYDVLCIKCYSEAPQHRSGTITLYLSLIINIPVYLQQWYAKSQISDDWRKISVHVFKGFHTIPFEFIRITRSLSTLHSPQNDTYTLTWPW